MRKGKGKVKFVLSNSDEHIAYHADGSIERGVSLASDPSEGTRHGDASLEGADVLDLTEALSTEAGQDYTAYAPVVNATLEDWQRIPYEGESAHIEVGGIDPLDRQLYMIQQCMHSIGLPGPLDQVSFIEYSELWKKFGARTGRVSRGVVVFDGSDTAGIGSGVANCANAQNTNAQIANAQIANAQNNKAKKTKVKSKKTKKEGPSGGEG